MLRRAAYWIAYRGINREIEIRSFWTVKVVGWQAELGACLPPAVLANHHAGVELVIETRSGAHGAGWRLDGDPATRMDAAFCRGLRMQLDLGVLRAFAQAR
jgi:hypothetical protein